MHQLLKLVKAPASEVAELKKLYDAQRQSGLARAPVSEPIGTSSVPSKSAQATLTLPQSSQESERSGKTLKPWIEVGVHIGGFDEQRHEIGGFQDTFGSDICVPSNKRKRTGQCQGERRKQRAEWCGPWSNGRSEPAQKAKPYNSSDEKRGGVIDKSIENEVGNLA
jgi:hypothetical protein